MSDYSSDVRTDTDQLSAYAKEDLEYLEQFERDQNLENSPSPLDGVTWPDDYPPDRANGADVRSTASRDVPGLSKAHIPPQVHRHSPHPTLTCYLQGGLVTYRSDRQVDAGSRGERGIIKGFSKASRARMMRLLGKIDRTNVPLFLTLTYPDAFPQNKDTWAQHIEVFRKRIARRGWSAIWRKEFKKRKSGRNIGKYAPHYHLLVWGCTYEELRSFAASAWYEIVGSTDTRHFEAGTRVEVLRDHRGTRGYVAKYAGKVQDDLTDIFPSGVGRLWGIINFDLVPWAVVLTCDLDNEDANRLIRYMRRYMRQKHVSSITVNMLCNSPEFWFDRYDDIMH